MLLSLAWLAEEWEGGWRRGFPMALAVAVDGELRTRGSADATESSGNFTA